MNYINVNILLERKVVEIKGSTALSSFYTIEKTITRLSDPLFAYELCKNRLLLKVIKCTNTFKS